MSTTLYLSSHPESLVLLAIDCGNTDFVLEVLGRYVANARIGSESLVRSVRFLLVRVAGYCADRMTWTVALEEAITEWIAALEEREALLRLGVAS